MEEWSGPCRKILDELPVAVFVLDPEGHPFYANQAARQLLGAPADPDIPVSEIARTYHFVLRNGDPYPFDQMPLIRAIKGETSMVDDMMIRHEGLDIPIEVWGGPIRDASGKLLFAAAAFQDISERLRWEREARSDSLTGLGNRPSLMNHLEAGLRRCGPDKRLAVFFIDLNRFKQVNDRFGHAVGDRILTEVASRLRAQIRRGESAFRIGGDEFVVVCEHLKAEGEAETIRRRLTTSLSEPYALDGLDVQLSATVGCASSDDSLTPPEHLLLQSDGDMYARKRVGADPAAHPQFNLAD